MSEIALDTWAGELNGLAVVNETCGLCSLNGRAVINEACGLRDKWTGSDKRSLWIAG